MSINVGGTATVTRLFNYDTSGTCYGPQMNFKTTRETIWHAPEWAWFYGFREDVDQSRLDELQAQYPEMGILTPERWQSKQDIINHVVENLKIGYQIVPGGPLSNASKIKSHSLDDFLSSFVGDSATRNILITDPQVLAGWEIYKAISID